MLKYVSLIIKEISQRKIIYKSLNEAKPNTQFIYFFNFCLFIIIIKHLLLLQLYKIV
jgi:hypothetical protein